MPFDREQIKVKVAELAARGVFIGTSSWKYEGWLDQLYTPARYEKKAKSRALAEQTSFANLQVETPVAKPVKVDKKTFEKDCLTEYAEVFKSVSVDATYYKFPDETLLRGWADAVPVDFRFAFKLTKDITIKRFPNRPEEGDRAGTVNTNFLNARLLADAFLQPCDSIRSKVGVLMLEFSHFWPSEYRRIGEFIEELDRFLSELPKGWPYAIELRNKDWLTPEYFACLARHRVVHVYNAWEAMPTVTEQMALPGSMTNPSLLAARFLLKPGRKYQDAKDTYHPYKLTHEVNHEARKAIGQLIKLALAATGGNLVKALIFINNRLEGNALNTIAAVLESGEWR